MSKFGPDDQSLNPEILSSDFSGFNLGLFLLYSQNPTMESEEEKTKLGVQRKILMKFECYTKI